MTGLQILEEFIFPRDVVAGLGYTIPLLASMLAVVEYGDLFSGIREIKSMLQKTILPVIRKMPIWVRPGAQYLHYLIMNFVD